MKALKPLLLSTLTILPFSLIASVVSCSSEESTKKEEPPVDVIDPQQEKVNKEVERINNLNLTSNILAFSTKQFYNIDSKNILSLISFEPLQDFNYKVLLFTKDHEKSTCTFKIEASFEKYVAISDDIVVSFNVLPLSIYNPFPSVEKIFSPENFYKLQVGANKQASTITNAPSYGQVKITLTYLVYGDTITRKIYAQTEKGDVIKNEKINIFSLELKAEKHEDFEFMTYVETQPIEGQKIDIILPNGSNSNQSLAISGQENITIISFANLPTFIYNFFTNPFNLYSEK